MRAFMLLAAGCGSESAAPAVARACFPGETRLCMASGGCQGAQACEADGQRFGSCDCGAPGATPDAGSRAAEPERAAVNQLGARCDADRECGPELSCQTEEAQSFAERPGGPAAGYCTVACDTVADCVAYDPSAGCGGGVCFLGCFSGEPRPGEGKCQNRGDLICWSSAALGQTAFDSSVRQSGVCMPACGSDEECRGRSCDLLTGLCVDTPSLGEPIGAACDTDEVCAGRVCLPSAAGPGFCSAPCSFGGLGCGYGTNAEPREAMCLASAVFDDSGSEGLGDLGLCLELCDAAADCSQPGWQCITAPDVRGRAGFCAASAGSLVADAGVEGGLP